MAERPPGSFRGIGLESRYSAGAKDMLSDFYIPVLSRAVRYDRAAGYFASSSFWAAAAGLARFIENEGEIRLLVGAQLTEDDHRALLGQVPLDEIMAERLRRAELTADDVARRRLQVIAWLVREGRLTIRVGLPCDDYTGAPIPHSDEQRSLKYFHSKYGVLEDAEGDRMAFEGSINESATGWQGNFESFSVYKSWQTQVWREHGRPIVDEFERLWRGGDVGGWRSLLEAPLPDLAAAGYTLLGHDWAEARRTWEEADHPTPPVMITVANRTETAARVKHAFDRKRIPVDGLCEPELTLHIDSKVLKKAEESEAPIAELPGGGGGKLTQKQQAEMLRRRVDTIGRPGGPGAGIRHVISVAMLSEGWDAKTVTHIMGLRAFSSQLLCEQVVGRGLRRTSYEVNEDGFFDPEHVNIFGVPFALLPHESPDGPPPPPKPKTRIRPLPEKARFEIEFPAVIRVERVYRTVLSLDWERVEPLALDPENTPTLAELAKTIDGKTGHTDIRIDTEEFWQGKRLQQLAFQAAAQTYDQMAPAWPGNRADMYARLAKLTQEFLASDRIEVEGLWNQEPLRRKILIGMNMTRIVGHFCRAVDAANTEQLTPVIDQERPIRSTGDMRPWYTGRKPYPARRCHINFGVYDGTLEPEAPAELDFSPDAEAWVKNDHLGFTVPYVHRGVVSRYLPDFLIRLRSGKILVLEVKGEPKEKDESKWAYMRDWVEAVNTHGGFGRWDFDVFTPGANIRRLLHRHNDSP